MTQYQRKSSQEQLPTLLGILQMKNWPSLGLQMVQLLFDNFNPISNIIQKHFHPSHLLENLRSPFLLRIGHHFFRHTPSPLTLQVFFRQFLFRLDGHEWLHDRVSGRGSVGRFVQGGDFGRTTMREFISLRINGVLDDSVVGILVLKWRCRTISRQFSRGLNSSGE